MALNQQKVKSASLRSTRPGKRVRLFGIDSPESDQTCQKDGTSWARGHAATEQLSDLVEGQQVECGGSGVDQYGLRRPTPMLAGCSWQDRLLAEGDLEGLAMWREVSRRYEQLEDASEKEPRIPQ